MSKSRGDLKMKTPLACYAFVFVLAFHGQVVSAQEEDHKAAEDGAAIQAAALPPSASVDQENMSPANSPGESPQRSFPSSHRSNYGSYDKKNCCWKSGPSAPYLNVRSVSQSEEVRRKIEYMLSKNEAVKKAISKKTMNCEKSHWGSEGLSDNCPSRYLRATEVRYWGKTCYIVRPNQQCATYRDCYSNRSCAAGRGGDGAGGFRKKRSSSAGGDSCYRTSKSSSTCLPDGYRTFQVWIYCDYNGFKLISMRLPQCCSCKRYNRCRF